jgi:YggT family protein
VTRPVLRPFRRIVPTFGGVDITPVLLIIIVAAAQRYLLPALEVELIKLVAPQALVGP